MGLTKPPIEKCKCGLTDHKRTTHKCCPLKKVLYGERKSDPAHASDVIINSSDECHSESDSEQLDYDYEESADGDDLNVYLCSIPVPITHVTNGIAPIMYEIGSGQIIIVSLPQAPFHKIIRKVSLKLDVTPSGTFWTQALKPILALVRCPSPLLLSQDKGQSTPAIFANPSSTLVTTLLKLMRLALVRCSTPSHVRGQVTTAVNVTPSGT
uniref:Uncharacterized protein n=1 Tax=Amphimedon queenslandica TaxID=400682 RepID=A0A1X7V772_AMPQE